MTPEIRKLISESILHKLGIRINPQLPVTESDDEVTLRSKSEIHLKLLQTWSIYMTLSKRDKKYYSDFNSRFQTDIPLSARESAIAMLDFNQNGHLTMQSRYLDRLYFLAWSAGLIKEINLNTKELNEVDVLAYIPTDLESFDKSIELQTKAKLLDWSDLLFRIHWAVRHANLIGKQNIGNIRPEAIPEWHAMVNWITNFEEEDNWDFSTMTSDWQE